MSEQDPPRLSLDSSGNEGNAFLRDAIADSKRDLPDETRLAAIALKLGPLLGAGAAGGGGAAAASGAGAAKASVAPAAAKIGAMSASMKLATAVAVTVAIGGGAVVAPRMISRPSAVTVAPTTNVVTSPSTALTSSTTILSLPPASASIAPPATPPTATMIVPPNPADEQRTLDRAQAALRADDPANALSLCNDDAILFPHGNLAQDREVIAIDALTRLGKMSDAKARAKKFEHDFPSSPDIPHIHTLIGQN